MPRAISSKPTLRIWIAARSTPRSSLRLYWIKASSRRPAVQLYLTNNRHNNAGLCSLASKTAARLKAISGSSGDNDAAMLW